MSKSVSLLSIFLPASIILALVVTVGLFFLIRYFIRYNAQQNNAKTPQQEEMDKMNTEDL